MQFLLSPKPDGMRDGFPAWKTKHVCVAVESVIMAVESLKLFPV